ncbi:MAG: ABC transporter permease [Candidatus Sumerlaeaceae bacterium]|nr:ABC transporter permease [Candidatus Sumerlaeaceae bacterium]
MAFRLLPFDYAARNAGRNWLRTVLTTGGAAAVIFLVILMGAFVQTLTSSLRATGDHNNAIVLGKGSEDFLEQSEIRADVPSILGASVESIVKREGVAMVSPEIVHAAVIRQTSAENPDTGNQRKGLVRGVTPMAFQLHSQIYLKEGKLPGSGEAVAGKLAATKLGLPESALQPGQTIFFEGRAWTISGVFEAPGTTFEAELWVPLEELKTQVKRETISCAVVRLKSPSDLTALQVFASSKLDLEITAVSEARFYSSLASFFRPMQVMGWVMAALVAVAGLFGGLNTLIAVIVARGRELACLETIGFSRRAIIVSLIQESLLMVGAGALIAAGLALLLLDGRGIRFVMGALSLQVDALVLAVGFGTALLLAVGGTAIASLRLIRTPLIELLRS